MTAVVNHVRAPQAAGEPADLMGLVEVALSRVEWRSGWAAGLEGSLAEGFGNGASDIDLVLIDPGDAQPAVMPAVLFAGGRRIEVRIRSAGQIREEFRVLAARSRRPSALTEDLLDRCQRLLGARWLRNHDVAEAVLRSARAELPDDFASIVAGWWGRSAKHSLRQAMAWALLGQAGEAAGWARTGLVQATKSWAAGRGETYVEPKWLAPQLARIGEPAVTDRFEALHSRRRITDPQEYVTQCLSYARGLGLAGLERVPERLHLGRMPGVTSWPVRDRVHVIRDRRNVFVLGETAGRVWRSVVFGQPLAEVVAAAPSAEAVLADFLRYGLLRLRCGGSTVCPRSPLAAPAGPMNPPPSTAAPLIGLDGAHVTGPESVDLLPLPADRFAAAAMNLTWSVIVLENLGEDLSGAVAARQWPSADLAVRRSVTVGLRAVLSAHGVAPLPPDPEIGGRIALIPGRAARLRAAADRVTATPVRDARSAAVARVRLAGFLRLVRTICRADEFPASFTSPGQWRDTLGIGYEWLRIGTHLGAPLPIGDARDLMSGGTQPHVRPGAARED
jgi:hypothetical protein